MRNDTDPNQISLFDSAQDRGVGRTRIVGGGGHSKLFHNYDNIISIENLLAAWREFLRGKRKRKDVELFSLRLTDNLISLHRQLVNKTYQHSSYTAFKINDPKPRDIHKATVRDRLLHHAIYRVLYPYFDTKFIHDSYSCRVDKGTHRAINRFRQMALKVSKNNTKTCYILKCDIRKFFANIDHNILKAILSRTVLDTDILWLLGHVINSFSARQNLARVGLPLGNLTSQLLVNVYMNEFDQYVKRELKVKHYIRYADDFVLLSEDKEYLQANLRYIECYLKEHLQLELHPDKVFIKTLASGVDFLGWVHFTHHRVPRTSTKNRMFRNLEKHHSKGALASYLGLLRHGNTHKLSQKIKPHGKA